MTRLVRASREEIPRKYQWQLSAAWDVEYERAKEWLNRQAAANIGMDKATFESAKDAGEALPEDVYHAFAGEEMNFDPDLMLAAEHGTLEREAPAEATLVGLMLSKLTLMSVESLIFFWIWKMTSNTPPMTIVMGAILAAIAFVTGKCGGLLLAARDRGDDLRKPTLWAGLVLGAGSLIALTWSRSPAPSERSAIVWIVTGAIALGIVVLEALHTELTARFKDRRSKMFTCQLWFANRKHKRVYEDGFWAKHYETKLRSLSQEMGRVFKGADDRIESVKA